MYKLQIERKKLYIEIVRIIACLCVIFTHTMERGYFLFSMFPENSLRYWGYMMLSVFVKAAVPMFFTISGALLINREESIGQLYKKRVLKIFIVLVLFSFLYYCRYIMYDINNFSFEKFFSDLATSNWNFTYWYLYAFLSFLIGLPFLRILAKSMREKDFKYLFLLVLLYKAIIPILEYVLWRGNESFNSGIRTLWLNTDIFIYPIWGHYLEHKVDMKTVKKWIVPLWIVNILTIGITCLMTYYKIKVTGECSESNSQTFFSCFSMINVATVYITVKYWLDNIDIPKLLEKMICSVGEATFGIYLLHLFFLQQLPMIQKVWRVLDRVLGPNSLISALVVCLTVMGLSYVGTLVMKKIPILKKII